MSEFLWPLTVCATVFMVMFAADRPEPALVLPPNWDIRICTPDVDCPKALMERKADGTILYWN